MDYTISIQKFQSVLFQERNIVTILKQKKKSLPGLPVLPGRVGRIWREMCGIWRDIPVRYTLFKSLATHYLSAIVIAIPISIVKPITSAMNAFFISPSFNYPRRIPRLKTLKKPPAHALEWEERDCDKSEDEGWIIKGKVLGSHLMLLFWSSCQFFHIYKTRAKALLHP